MSKLDQYALGERAMLQRLLALCRRMEKRAYRNASKSLKSSMAGSPEVNHRCGVREGVRSVRYALERIHQEKSS